MKVFADDDQAKILAAIDEYPQFNVYGHDNRASGRTSIQSHRHSARAGSSAETPPIRSAPSV